MIKNIVCYFFPFFLAVFIFSSCPTGSGGNGNSGNGNDTVVKTGKVTFVNHTSYGVVVHQDYFNGPVLLELSSGQDKSVDVRISDNYGIGTTFSIEYLWQINEGFDTESGKVIASGIDPNVQINFVVEEINPKPIQIPQPKNLEFKSAFIKILNMHNLPCELRYLSTVFKQTGNGNISVQSGKTGVYKLENIPAGGKLYQNYEVVSTFTSIPVPDFTTRNGNIESFRYDGNTVTHTGTQTMVFNREKQ